MSKEPHDDTHKENIFLKWRCRFSWKTKDTLIVKHSWENFSAILSTSSSFPAKFLKHHCFRKIFQRQDLITSTGKTNWASCSSWIKYHFKKNYWVLFASHPNTMMCWIVYKYFYSVNKQLKETLSYLILSSVIFW